MLLALKLLLVPAFLAGVSLASRRWGPRVGGWLAGMPLVTGPILFILALEQETAFTAAVASGSLLAVAPGIAFGFAYSHLALRAGWLPSLAGALLAWTGLGAALVQLPPSPWLSLAIALASLLAGPHLFPRVTAPAALRAEPRYELPARMLAAALVVLFTTGVAEYIGSRWTGLIAMFPLLSTLLAVFSHRSQGAAYAVIILRALARGLYALTAFCLVVALALPQAGVALTFVAAVLAVIAVQWITRPRGGS
jgi:hypothetical protein